MIMVNRILLALILCIPLVSVLQGQAEDSMVLRKDFFSSTLNRTYEYNVYLPSGYEGSDARYPVIYLLHGRGDNMDGWLEARAALDELIADGSIPPLIAVMPDMPSSERASYYVDSQYTGAHYPAEPVESAFIGDLIP